MIEYREDNVNDPNVLLLKTQVYCAVNDYIKKEESDSFSPSLSLTWPEVVIHQVVVYGYQ